MQKQKIIAFIRNIELLKGLNDQELDVLADYLDEQTYEKGQLLFEENGPRRDIFIIYRGEVELFKTRRFGAETRLSHFNVGDFLG